MDFASGRSEQYEDILNAGRREVKEAPGLDVKLINTTCIPLCIVYGTLNINEEEIVVSKWITVREIWNIADVELLKGD